jgi:hypothetical protein
LRAVDPRAVAPDPIEFFLSLRGGFLSLSPRRWAFGRDGVEAKCELTCLLLHRRRELCDARDAGACRLRVPLINHPWSERPFYMGEAA